MNLRESFDKIREEYKGIIYTSGPLTTICAHVLACINGTYPMAEREIDKEETLRSFETFLRREKGIRSKLYQF